MTAPTDPPLQRTEMDWLVDQLIDWLFDGSAGDGTQGLPGNRISQAFVFCLVLCLEIGSLSTVNLPRLVSNLGPSRLSLPALGSQVQPARPPGGNLRPGQRRSLRGGHRAEVEAP